MENNNNSLWHVHSLKNHNQQKEELLNSIDDFSKNNFIVDKGQSIFNTDWNIPENVPRKYFELFWTKNHSEIENIYQKLYENFTIKNLYVHNWWFQQYVKGSYHQWHTHDRCNFSNVYYLELPNNESATEFYVNGKNITIEAKEGDLVVFPAHLPHRSINNFPDRKTVIVFNTSIEI